LHASSAADDFPGFLILVLFWDITDNFLKAASFLWIDSAGRAVASPIQRLFCSSGVMLCLLLARAQKPFLFS